MAAGASAARGKDRHRWAGWSDGHRVGARARGVLGGCGYLGAPGRVVRIGPWVRVKGPARCRLCPAGQTSRLWGADIRPGEGALVPGGLGPLVGPCSPPVPAAATAAITAPGATAMAASLWARSGYSRGLGGHPVLLARACWRRRAVSPQGVGACHRHLVELSEQQREGPILGAFAAAHDGLGWRGGAGRRG